VTILTKREVWAKPRLSNETRRASDLTPDEQANVRLAVRFLRTRVGGSAKLAAILKVKTKVVEKACAVRGRPSAGLAIRVARVAGASVEEVLSGAWPAAGACPHCGRGAKCPGSV
jgi:plasmid maintenance system antidote protein VapI